MGTVGNKHGNAVSFQQNDFFSFVYKIRSGIVGPFGSFNFNYLGNFQTASIISILIYIPANTIQGFSFFILSPVNFYNTSSGICNSVAQCGYKRQWENNIELIFVLSNPHRNK